MKKLIAALVLVALSTSGAMAGEVQSSTLSKMGFSGATAMSDADGLAVRGKGTTVVIVGANAINVGGAAAIGHGNVAVNVQIAKASFKVYAFLGSSGHRRK